MNLLLVTKDLSTYGTAWLKGSDIMLLHHRVSVRHSRQVRPTNTRYSRQVGQHDYTLGIVHSLDPATVTSSWLALLQKKDTWL